MSVLVTQSCLTLCNPTDCSLDSPGKKSGLPFPSPEDLPDLGIEPWSPALQAGSLLIELQGSPVIKLYPPTSKLAARTVGGIFEECSI